MKPCVDIVVVNWNAGDHLKRCIESIFQSTADFYRIGKLVVVDNGSHDGSLLFLSALGKAVTVISNDRNLGFAAASNLGAVGSQSDFLLFLNPDVVLEVNSLDGALQFVQSAAGTEIAVCGIQLNDLAGKTQRSCARDPQFANLVWYASGLSRLSPRRFPGITLAEWDHSGSAEVQHVIGAFYLTRRTVFFEVGGFDERFFVYLEDLDLSKRIRELGWKIQYETNVHATHIGGATSAPVKDIAMYYSLRSRLLYARKYLSPSKALGVFAATLVIEPAVRLIVSVGKRDLHSWRNTIRAYVKLFKVAKACWQKPPALDKVAASAS